MGFAFWVLWSRQDWRPNCRLSIRELWGVHELLPKLFSREFKFGRSPGPQNSDRIQEIQGGQRRGCFGGALRMDNGEGRLRTRGWSANSGRLRHTQMETEYGICILGALEQARLATELPADISGALGRPRTAPEIVFALIYIRSLSWPPEQRPNSGDPGGAAQRLFRRGIENGQWGRETADPWLVGEFGASAAHPDGDGIWNLHFGCSGASKIGDRIA